MPILHIEYHYRTNQFGECRVDWATVGETITYNGLDLRVVSINMNWVDMSAVILTEDEAGNMYEITQTGIHSCLDSVSPIK